MQLIFHAKRRERQREERRKEKQKQILGMSTEKTGANPFLYGAKRFSNCHRALNIEEIVRGGVVGRGNALLMVAFHLAVAWGTCHYLLYFSSPFITKYFCLSFVAFCVCECVG